MINKNIDRRSLLKGAAALGVTASISQGGIDFAYAEGTIDTSKPVEKRYSICDMCNQVPRCGMVAYVQDEKIVRVESREDHPVDPLCAKGMATIQEMYDPHRLMYPMVRTNPKGEPSEWKQISWDEAYDTIVEKFNETKEKYGPDSVLFYCGDPKEPRPALQRLATLFGSSSYGLESSLCATASQMANQLVNGKRQGWFGVDPSKDTKSVIIWSLNAAWSQPNRHKKLMEAKERGVKFLVVDPRVTPTATGLADVFLQPRPGSDAALALGFMNLLIEKNYVDMDFVNKWTLGFEELKALAAEFTPEKVEELTWVPAEKLIEAVELIGPNMPCTLVSSSAGLTHCTNVGNAQRAVMMLPALLGQIDVAGGYKFPYPAYAFDPYGATPQFKAKALYKEKDLASHRVDKEDFPVWALLTDHIQTAKLPEYINDGKIKAAMLMAFNSMIWPSTHVYQEAIQKLDFSFAVDYYYRPWSHDYVDMILPAAMCMERQAPMTVYGNKIFYREVCMPPAGEAREDWQICLELGSRLGFEEECFGGDVTKALEYCLETSGYGITLDELKAHPEGMELPTEKNIDKKYELGKLRLDGQPGFETPSGKIEFASEILKENGYEPLPKHVEPVHSPYNEIEEDRKYPLVLCTGGRLPYYTHSKLREIPWLNQFMPEPVVRMHKDAAEARGIKEGDKVKVFNQFGEVEMVAEITNIVTPGMVDIFHGWHQANINELVSRDFDPVTGYPGFRSSLCEIELL
ncbi:MAG: molybdopterin-dependent oxidoreductase [Coriobacteriia bacterium]|nr:molybdopterin-dependent oxidoreductase [Coriobacteriia bacterium]